MKHQHLTDLQLSEMLDGFGGRKAQGSARACGHCRARLEGLRRVKNLTRGLYEEVAVPADFHARVLARIQPQAAVAPETARHWWENIPALARPRALAPALAGALCLFLATNWTPSPRETFQPEAPKPVAQAPVAPSAPAASLKKIQAPSPVSRETSPLAKPANAAALNPAPAAEMAKAYAPNISLAGRLNPQAGVVSSLSVARPGAGAPASPASAAPSASLAKAVPHPPGPSGGEPTQVPTTAPTAAPAAVPFVHSQVRNNVVRVSRGQSAQILFSLESPGHVKVEIFTRLGAKVAVLADKDFPAGVQTLAWDGRDGGGAIQASGIYQVSIQAGSWSAFHKILLVR